VLTRLFFLKITIQTRCLQETVPKQYAGKDADQSEHSVEEAEKEGGEDKNDSEIGGSKGEQEENTDNREGDNEEHKIVGCKLVVGN
jgi:hypothetical protein